MGVSRYLHTAFYILYLILLAIALWLLLYYAKVPGWVWIFFGLAILIFIIGVLLKEFVLRQTIDASGNVIHPQLYWVVLYSLFHVMAFILLIVGVGFAIRYSASQWWMWVVLGLAIFLTVLSNMFYYYFSNTLPGIILSLLGVVLLLVGLILVVAYSLSPWWVWLILGLAILFAFMAGLLESFSAPNVNILNAQPEVLVPIMSDEYQKDLTKVQQCQKECYNECVRERVLNISGVSEDIIYKM